MKVVAGKLKGRVLKGPKHIRPVTSFIKEAIFNILQGVDWQNTTVLDVFTGAGNFGIEALSRGAKKVIFVDLSPESRRFIYENLAGVDWNGAVFIGDFRDVVKKLFKKGEKFNIIFADPPFDNDLGREVINLFQKYDVITDDGLMVLRLRNNEVVEFSDIWLVEKRLYGDSAVYLIKKKG